MLATILPAITGNQLIRLLEQDGWAYQRDAKHGAAYSKEIDGRNVVAIIPTKNDSLPDKTLGAILSVKQTGIGRRGLVTLIKKYGL